MRKLTLTPIAGAAALAFGVAAYAQEAPAPQAPQRELTRAAAEQRAAQAFDRLDTNHEGTVTRDEAKAGRDNMRQQWQSRREARDR